MLNGRWQLAGWALAGLGLVLAAVAVAVRTPGAAAGPAGEGLPGVARVSPGASPVAAIDADGRRRTEVDAAPGTAPSSKEPAGESVATGTVSGLLTTASGQPIANRRMRLEGRLPGVRTDADGLFRFEQVPVGPQSVYVDARPPSIREEMLVRVATTRVFADRDCWVPAVLGEGHALSGRMLVTDEVARTRYPGSYGSLRLVLTTRAMPFETVAHAVVSTTRPLEPEARPTPEQLYELGFDDYESFAEAARDPNDPPEFAVGAFRFEHLAPDVYRLRIAPDGNEVVRFELDGVRYRAELYEEREVDLTYEDVELPLEEFTLEGFLQRAVDRDGLVPVGAGEVE